jgi:hypothetical protein
MPQLIVSMGTIVYNKLQMSNLMGSGNVYTWHDHMCWQPTWITT